MKTYYWIIRFRLSRLLKLLWRRRRQEIAAVSYLESTRPVNFLLKVLRKANRLKLNLQRIEPRETASGPQLNLSTVRNDKGEVITFDVLHHVLRVRRRAWEKMRESFEGYPFFGDSVSANMKAAYFGLRIAEEVTPVVYIADYAQWQNYQSEGKSRENILVIPRSQWSAVLEEDLAPQLHRLIIEKKEFKRKIKGLVLVVKHVTTAAVKTGFKGFFKRSPEALAGEKGDPQEQDAASLQDTHKDSPKKGKIMALYAMGVFGDRRNDISYIHAASIPPERLVLFCRYKALIPSAEEMEWLKENKVMCYSAPGIKPIPGILPWQPSPGLQDILKEFYYLYLQTFRKCLSQHKRRSFWLLDKYWEMGQDSAQWIDFFRAQNIRILVHQIPTDENFILTYAISEAGGISVSLERSMLVDYCTYLHNPPNHLYLVTGAYSITQIPEPSFSLCTVQVGGFNVVANQVDIPGLDALKEKHEVLLSVFDEVPSDWFFGDSIREFYRALVELVDQDHRFGMLIKSKKPQVFQKLPEVDQDIRRLEKQGRCILLDWRVPVSTAAACSDLAVCMPSTAVFESFLTGTPTVIFNPMRCGSRLFYRDNGLGRRVFEDRAELLSALKRYAGKKDGTIGDCSDLADFVDPFNDGKGAERIGNYLKWCLEGFEAGRDRSRTIKTANERYIKTWGKDKVTSANAYEQSVPCYRGSKGSLPLALGEPPEATVKLS